MSTNAVSALALAALFAGAAQAQPAVFTERAQVLPTGSVIHAYRVPTTDVNGKIRYSDLEIQLSVNDAGKIDARASVLAVPSPKVLGNSFVAGTYKDTDGATCTLGPSVLPSGRQVASLACVNSVGRDLSASWATGLIDGHPFELDLRAAGIDTIPGYTDFAWGKLGVVTQTAYWGCMGTGEILSASQTGNQLTLNGYDFGKTQLCGVTLILQP